LDSEQAAKILTIEDEAYIRESIRTYLEDYGFEVVEADNGRAGLDLFEKEAPDLVIVDLRMPEMDGLQVLEVLKNRSPETPLIIVSGTGSITSVVEALHLGAWDYILKPIQDMNILYHAVTKCLNESRLQRENLAYQQRLKELVLERTRELQESEERYKAIFEYTGTAMVILDEDKVITMANSRFADLAGYSREEIQGKLKWTDFVVLDDIEKINSYHAWRRDPDLFDKAPLQHEFRFLRKDGEIRYILVTVAMIQGTSKSVASLLDITEKRDGEEREKELEKKLRNSQKMEAIGTLAGGIAHDFNNILSPIMGYADMMMRSSEPDSRVFERSRKIRTAALRAADLVRQILSFNRGDEEGAQAVKIHPVVKEALKFIRASIPTTIRITDRVDTDCGFVEVDPTHIHQIIMNLCTNAFHAMEETGGELVVSLEQVTISQRDLVSGVGSMLKRGAGSDEFLCLEVRDTGVGMAEDIQDRIFDPYFTTKTEGKGTGLGLATVYGIVMNCRGDISVRSVPGEGTCFTILFPVVKPDSRQVENGPGNQAPGLGAGERLMFIDDDQNIAEMCREGLELLNYRVKIFYSGLDALDYFMDNHDSVDLVISDQTMPGKTGLELAREMISIRKDIPVILCSGYMGGISAATAADAGVRSFVMKPVTVEALSERIQHILYPDRGGVEER